MVAVFVCVSSGWCVTQTARFLQTRWTHNTHSCLLVSHIHHSGRQTSMNYLVKNHLLICKFSLIKIKTKNICVTQLLSAVVFMFIGSRSQVLTAEFHLRIYLFSPSVWFEKSINVDHLSTALAHQLWPCVISLLAATSITSSSSSSKPRCSFMLSHFSVAMNG